MNAQFVFQLILLAMGASAFAQHSQQTGSGSLPAPGGCPAGATCRTGTGSMDTRSSGIADSGDPSDAFLQRVWSVAQQLRLTSNQHTELKSSLKGETDEGIEANKAVQDARSALANALANGQTFLDSEIEGLASANAKAQEHELKLWAKLYAVLTPDQQRRLLTMSTPLSLATASQGIPQAQQ